MKGNPEIAPYAEELSNNEPFVPDSDDVISLLGTIAFASPADFGDIVEVDGEQKFIWKDIGSLRDDLKRAIASIKNTRCGIEIEMLDRLKATEMLLKYLGVTGSEGVTITGEKDIE